MESLEFCEKKDSSLEGEQFMEIPEKMLEEMPFK